RQVSTIFRPLNQYRVVMEVAPEFWQSPDTLREIYVSTAGGSIRNTASTNSVASAVAPSPATVGAATGGSAASTATGTAIANSAVANQRANALANRGRGGTSTGAAVSTSAETMVPLAAF